MRLSVAALITLVLAAGPATAQTVAPGNFSPAGVGAQPAPTPWSTGSHSDGSLFQSVKGDFKNLFTNVDTAKTIGLASVGALVASKWDTRVTQTASAEWSKGVFGPGRIAGGFWVQAAAGAGTYFVGKAAGNNRIASLGNHLLRAQIVSQTVIQGAKFASNRSRPDASNNHSMPSGHTASAFAAASVIHEELGWKGGIPAYVFATYIGASRMEANRHYLSDVIMGAGIGLAVGHSVTMHVGSQKFALGVAPAQGGAAVMFTRR